MNGKTGNKMKKIVWLMAVSLLFSFTLFAIDTDNSIGYPYYPDPKITIGTYVTFTADVICQIGYTKDIRHVTNKTKKAVFAAYGITNTAHYGNYEIDHFISLEDGGSNDIKNLWPQPYKGKVTSIVFGAREKDVVETNLHKRMCKGDLTLAEVKKILATDWVGYYCKLKGIIPKANDLKKIKPN